MSSRKRSERRRVGMEDEEVEHKNEKHKEDEQRVKSRVDEEKKKEHKYQEWERQNRRKRGGRAGGHREHHEKYERMKVWNQVVVCTCIWLPVIHELFPDVDMGVGSSKALLTHVFAVLTVNASGATFEPGIPGEIRRSSSHEAVRHLYEEVQKTLNTFYGQVDNDVANYMGGKANYSELPMIKGLRKAADKVVVTWNEQGPASN
ncbi:hypothetical protein B0T13DRAFT_444655 [Neurospora crassa]|nr:hypothetical protein B0T13DRAFT_444655 [Neurospora crassa]